MWARALNPTRLDYNWGYADCACAHGLVLYPVRADVARPVGSDSCETGDPKARPASPFSGDGRQARRNPGNGRRDFRSLVESHQTARGLTIWEFFHRAPHPVQLSDLA